MTPYTGNMYRSGYTYQIRRHARTGSPGVHHQEGVGATVWRQEGFKCEEDRSSASGHLDNIGVLKALKEADLPGE